jgi:glycerol-3-phosphate acyltransferase PlsY
MTLTQFWGLVSIVLVCPLLGGLPLIDWLTYAIAGRNLARLGTGNISVSAAFYHGGTFVGILAVLSEAGKGIVAILVARYFFPNEPVWELIAAIALIIGRYWIAKGAGTTNLFWASVTHDWQAALLTLLLGGSSFIVCRDRKIARTIALCLLSLILIVRHPQDNRYVIAAIALAVLSLWIYRKIPDDLDLPSQQAKASRKMFRFFRGDRAICTLDSLLEANKVGEKTATLAKLKQLGYAVPDGWILQPGDNPQALVEFLEPSESNPLIVRSSAIGEDSSTASAAGQYLTIANVTTRQALHDAILNCQASYNNPAAAKYRQDRKQADTAMAVLIQKQIRGTLSGVAFSRDPVEPQYSSGN